MSQDRPDPARRKRRKLGSVAAFLALGLGCSPAAVVLAKAVAPVPGDERIPQAGAGATCQRSGGTAPAGTKPDPVGYALVPGLTIDTAASVKVSDTTTYDAAGKILLVSVYIPRLSWLSYDLAKRDCRSILLSKRQVLGDKSPAEDKADNVAEMGWSKDTALHVAMARLGVAQDVQGGGVIIDRLCKESASDGSCLSAPPSAAVLAVGDVVTELDGAAIHQASDLTAALAGKRAGDVVSVGFRRGTASQTAPVTLTSAADGRGIIGFVPNPRPPADLRFKYPFPIEIDSLNLQGPSAGLAFTLAVLDRLTPGELTGGKIIAATGEIDLSGRIGEIGGLAQKTATILARGNVDVFLVPASQEAEASKAAAGSRLKVIPVRTLDDALAALASLGGDTERLLTPATTTTASPGR